MPRSRDTSSRVAKSDTKRQKQPSRQRFDGELYQRPVPSPFSENWNEGFLDGYDNKPMAPGSDKEYRDGFVTGHDQREFEQSELDASSSSNP